MSPEWEPLQIMLVDGGALIKAGMGTGTLLINPWSDSEFRLPVSPGNDELTEGRQFVRERDVLSTERTSHKLRELAFDEQDILTKASPLPSIEQPWTVMGFTLSAVVFLAGFVSVRIHAHIDRAVALANK